METNIDYKALYEKKLAEVRDYYDRCQTEWARKEIEDIFPELRESEDERMRNRCIELIREAYSTKYEAIECISWLEKQKEIQFGVPGLYYYNGEKVYYYGSPATEENLEEQDVDFSTNDTSKNDARKRRQIIALLSASKEKCMAPFAKDIDECVAYLIEKQKKSLHIQETCKENAGSFTDEEDERTRKELIIFLKAHQGYTLDNTLRVPKWIAYLERQKEPEKEELYAEAGTTEEEYIANTMKKVRALREKQKEQKPEFHLPPNFGMAYYNPKPLKEQKPAEWSEEDQERLDRVTQLIEHFDGLANEPTFAGPKFTHPYTKEIEWLHNLRPQKQEWSKGDEKMINKTINLLAMHNNGCVNITDINECSTWLKSLRPQPHWKPSEEQVKDLKVVENILRKGNYIGLADGIESLQTDLLKLK